MWLLYQILYAVTLLVAAPFLLLRRGGHYLRTLPGRLTIRLPPPRGDRPLWLHAVSVGEVGVAHTLAAALPEDTPLLVTTVTPTGQERARAQVAGRADVTYLPVDLGFAVSRFLRRCRPGALVLVEGDYWPLVLARLHRRGVPVAVINGRVGDATFRRLRWMRPLLRHYFGAVGRFGVQSAEDRRRLVALGVDAARVEVTGNLKFDTPEPVPLPALAAHLERLAGGRPLLVAGSTMEGEEEQVLAAFRAAGGGDRALLVLAPRHPERWDEVARLVAAEGFETARRSRLEQEGGGHGGGSARPDVLLLDSLGELASVYRHAAVAFIGGTLVPTGGHNPLEPARFGVPIAVGPSLENFRDMAALFDAADAWQRVDDATALGDACHRWLDDPAAARLVGERAQRLVDANRGAVERTRALIEPLLPNLRMAAISSRETAETAGISSPGA